jgi:pimeloyl-ACP methyl ester carboxylesterase/DNA-binding SARP family transcriptional activator
MQADPEQSSRTDSASRVELSLHGYPSVQVNGRPIALKLKHGLALLAYLGDKPQRVGRDALAALLWPDARPGLGRGRLRRLVHELHGVLGVNLIDGDALGLASGCGSDLARTARAIASADLPALVEPLAAEVLAGFCLGSDAFDDWLDARRREQRAALVRALERGIGHAIDARDSAAAEQAAQALLRHEPCAESGHIARLWAAAQRGDAAAVEAAYFDAAQRWREELGLKPSARIEAAYAQAQQTLRRRALPFEVAYAPTRHGQVAYTVWGDGQGSETLVLMWGLMSNLEVGLDEPRVREMLHALAQRHRVVMIDRRGTGLSERIGVAPDAASATEDVIAVLDGLGLHRAWLFGCSVGGTMSMDVALRRPDRIAGLLLYGASPCGHWSPETPWGLKPEGFERWVDRLSDPAKYDKGLRLFAPSVADDPQVQRWYARLLRHAASRVGVIELLRAFHAVDLRSRLHALRLPTLVMQRQGDIVVPAAAGELLARAIPGAQLERLDGEDHFLWCGDARQVVTAIERFVERHGQARQTEPRAA